MKEMIRDLTRGVSRESQAYVSIVVVGSLACLLWILMHPPTLAPGSGVPILIASLLAAALEMSAAPVPYFGAAGAAGAAYLFIILMGGSPIAAIVAFLSAAARAWTRDRGPVLLRIFSPFQRLLCVGMASIPSVITGMGEAAPLHDSIMAAAAPVYFVVDALTDGTAAGFILDEESQKHWFRGRYRMLALGLLAPLIGAIGYFLATNTVALSMLLASAILLHLAILGIIQRETAEGNVPMITELGQVRDNLQFVEKRYDELKQQVAQKNFELGLLLDFGRSIGTNLTLDYAFDVLQEIFKKLFSYQSCIIFFAATSSGGSVLRPKKFVTPYEEFCKSLYIPFGESIVGTCAKARHGFVTDARRVREYSLLIENERSEMAVPLIVEDRVKGVLYVGHSEEAMYDDTHLQLLTTIAYQAAIVLVYAESYEYTVALATTDGLTGLYTHRYFQERLLEEVKRSERYHQPLSLIMLDLDHFKEYNDTFGHPMGDALLKKVSQILKDCTRESDIVCRYGGDEFIILLVETTKETAVTIAKRIREAVELRVNGESPVGGAVKITSSIGVAGFPEDASNKSDLLREADKALYQSKQAGRNRVVAAKRSG